MKKKLLAIISLVILLSITTSSCMEKKYEYDIMMTSADGYKCMVSWTGGGHLGQAPMPFSTGGSWGDPSAAMAGGPKMKSLPKSLHVIYFSLTENQFYELHADVDSDRIRSLLEVRYERKGFDEKASFLTFIVGIAPGGFVNLWIGGDAGTMYLDSFYAKKIDYDYGRAFPTRTWNREEAVVEYSEDLHPFIKEEIAKGEISGAYWDSLNTSYDWKLAFNDTRFSLYDYRIYTINQEARLFRAGASWPVEKGEKYLPAKMVLYLEHTMDPVQYKILVNLREESIWYKSYKEEKGVTVLKHMNKSREILSFFESFYSMIEEEEVSIYLEFDDSMQTMKLMLKTPTQEIEFPSYTYKIYDSETYIL